MGHIIYLFHFKVGPYVFREEHEKTNITFNKSDHTVQYMQKKFWYFDAEKSSGSLDDEIFTLNMVAVAASDATRYPGGLGLAQLTIWFPL